ncbi:MAG: hypothetical protein ACK51V_00625 [bacterium]|jgi:hypothetical protein|nr:hypothetical protein [Betaproteobacteria bacterium]
MKKAVGLMKMSDVSLAGASGASFGGLTTAEAMEGFKSTEADHFDHQPITISVPATDDMMNVIPSTKPTYYDR